MEWTDSQNRVLSFGENLCVLAGAGTGKTMTLVELFLRLIEGRVEAYSQGLEAVDILALTYTEKAAREMRDRIRKEINHRVRSADQVGRPFWVRQRRMLDQAQISTIHSFCLQALRRYSFEAGLDPDFGILDDEGELQAETTLETLRDLLEESDPELIELLDYFRWTGLGRGVGLDRMMERVTARIRTFGLELSPDSPAVSVSVKVEELKNAAEAIGRMLERGEVKPTSKVLSQGNGFS